MFTFSANLAHGFLIPIISGIPEFRNLEFQIPQAKFLSLSL